MNTIVAALDLEAGSDAVLARAIQLASAHGARLIVVHVVEAEQLSNVAASSGRSEDELQDELKQQALATIESHLIESGRTRRTEVHVAFGTPHDVISRLVHERGADAVVIGPGKGHSLKEKILGSTADRVVRTSSAPVLLVKNASTGPYERVVVAVDLSPKSEEAVMGARKLAPEAALQLVHAVEIPLMFRHAMQRAGTSQGEIARYRAARVDNARKELATFVHALLGGEKVTARILDGDPGSALVHLSKDGHIDLLVMGSHGHDAISRALLGSVTQRLLRESECDLLIVATHGRGRSGSLRSPAASSY